MHILMTGAAGMIGRKLTARLVKDGKLNGKQIDRLTLTDVISPEKPQGFKGTVDAATSDLSTPGAAAKAVGGKPDVIFHLAGVVSGEAETDSRRAIGSISTARVHCSRQYAQRPTRRKWSSPHRSPFLVRHFQILFPTNFISLRLHRTERRRRSASFCLPTTRGAVSSTVSASGCRRFACGPASRTRPPRGSSPGSSGSR